MASPTTMMKPASINSNIMTQRLNAPRLVARLC
jgi:hypothetical protein